MNKIKASVKARIIKARETIQKADTATQLNVQDAVNAGDWLEPPTDLKGLKILVSNSTILPQCIRAYKNNIAGFGIGIRYIEDIDETPEMAAEYQAAEEILELLTIEQDTKEIFEDIIETRETYGTAYLEVIRNLAGEVVQIEFIRDTPSIRKTKPLVPYIDYIYYHHGQETIRKKKFCKYKQEIGGKTIYFKEFGDPRIMDNRSGEYVEVGESIDLTYHANEIMEFSLGTMPYGEVRWMGQVLGIDGSRKAERLNNNYFRNGRHTPLMIIVRNGTLTDGSFVKLQQYMDDIKGENGQHAFLLLEAEGAEGRTDFDQTETPDIEIKDLASILQKDELFQNYLDNNRRKVQSAFQLPDLYVGYTTDFNRATAQTAQEVTEEQIFQPERISLAWVINNKLLNGYRFKHVEVYFKAPNITNPDDVYKILSVCSRAGGLTPNKAKEIIYSAYGEVSEDYEDNWGDIPIGIDTSSNPHTESEIDIAQLTMSLEQQISKAAAQHDDAIVAVMKEVRNLLLQNSQKGLHSDEECAILKTEWNEDDHPRDERGRFASTGTSPSGANTFTVRGFRSKQKLNNHWNNGRTHQSEYVKEGITTKEQYAQRALELIESPTNETILGNMDKAGNIIRYDTDRNDFVKGHPHKGITTMFKPIDGQKYYNDMRTEDLNHGGKA